VNNQGVAVQFLAGSRSFAVLIKCPDLTRNPLYHVYLSSFKVKNEGAIPLPCHPIFLCGMRRNRFTSWRDVQ